MWADNNTARLTDRDAKFIFGTLRERVSTLSEIMGNQPDIISSMKEAGRTFTYIFS
ncbi:hypothetical protein [Dulcicalothrix desertica]|uniref:hypothetical protein n=1 Tax=Dulcicalothrix desertica TaxID=32056 RepID=UPI00119BA339|nr:hypothetical protein [Dulcicalothrix desertica]TWH54446.1 hypothetical protein CAL7102_02484 [Dulcicalothrix desertica PCC 7102]